MTEGTLADLDAELNAMAEHADVVIDLPARAAYAADQQTNSLAEFVKQAIAISLNPDNVKRAADAANYRDLTAGAVELAKIHQLITGEADSRSELKSLNVNVEPGSSPKTRLMKYVGGMLAHGDQQRAAEEAVKDD